MKTFKLKSLEIVEDNKAQYQTIKIPLHDGLIINQEDEANTWMIEAYTDAALYDFFVELREKDYTFIVHVKITTELNEKATCMIKIVDLNEINDKISVLFIGPMLKQRTDELEKMLAKLISEGYREDALLEQFKVKCEVKV